MAGKEDCASLINNLHHRRYDCRRASNVLIATVVQGLVIITVVCCRRFVFSWERPTQSLLCNDLLVACTMLQTLRSVTHAQRQACTRVSTFWGVAAATSQQQIRYLSSTGTTSAGTGEEAIMGVMGTSVTKKLWQERLTKNKDRLQHLPLPTPTPKLPQPTAVTYAFSSDRFLQEQASDCLSPSFTSSVLLNIPETHSIETHGIKCVLASCWKTLILWLGILHSSTGEPDFASHSIQPAQWIQHLASSEYCILGITCRQDVILHDTGIAPLAPCMHWLQLS